MTAEQLEVDLAMIPTAAALAVAVADDDPAAVRRILGPLRRRADMKALVVALAAQVHLDEPLRRDVPHRTHVQVSTALSKAAERFGTTVAHLTTRDRRREVVEARQVAIYASHLAGMSYSAIGRAIERDHTTVMHACSRVGESSRLRNAATAIALELGWVRGEDGAG